MKEGSYDTASACLLRSKNIQGLQMGKKPINDSHETARAIAPCLLPFSSTGTAQIEQPLGEPAL